MWKMLHVRAREKADTLLGNTARKGKGEGKREGEAKQGVIELIDEKTWRSAAWTRQKVLPEQPRVSSGTMSSDHKPALLF